MLVDGGDRKEAEQHRDYEDVVHGEWLLDQVTGDVLMTVALVPSL